MLSATPGQGSYTPATGVWAIGALPFKAQVTLTLVAQVEQAGRSGTWPGTLPEQVRPENRNDSDVSTSRRQPVADIQVHKTADMLVLPVGNDVTFTVTVTNTGRARRAGLSSRTFCRRGWPWSVRRRCRKYTPTTGVWAIGALAVGAQTTLTLRATVQADRSAHESRRQDGAGGTGPEPLNDVSGVTVNGRAADVQVVKTVDRPLPQVGEMVTFTMTVRNNGPNAVSGVEVLDGLSARLTFVSATPSQGTYTAATGLWAVGRWQHRGPAATATLQVTATVTSGPLTNLAVKIDQDQPDPNPTNDQDSIAPPACRWRTWW